LKTKESQDRISCHAAKHALADCFSDRRLAILTRTRRGFDVLGRSIGHYQSWPTEILEKGLFSTACFVRGRYLL